MRERKEANANKLSELSSNCKDLEESLAQTKLHLEKQQHKHAIVEEENKNLSKQVDDFKKELNMMKLDQTKLIRDSVM